MDLSDLLGLARRLEMAEALTSVELAAVLRQSGALPEATSLAVGGGYATFAGVGSPVSQAFGLGLSSPCSAGELDRLEEFFRSRGAGVAIEVAAPADPGLARALVARGYVIEDQSDVLVHRLGSSGGAAAHAGMTVRRAAATEIPAIVELVIAGFFEGKPTPPAFTSVIESMFRTANSTVYVAEHEGRLVGAALLTVQRRIGILSGATTLPVFRGRGVQGALLRARVAAAGSLRAEVGMVATLSGTTSYRNAERAGFQSVYGRTKYIKPFIS